MKRVRHRNWRFLRIPFVPDIPYLWCLRRWYGLAQHDFWLIAREMIDAPPQNKFDRMKWRYGAFGMTTYFGIVKLWKNYSLYQSFEHPRKIDA